MFGIIIYQSIVIQISRRESTAYQASRISDDVEEWIAQKPENVPTRLDEPRIGSPAAPVQIVVFSDFQCPGCADVSMLLEQAAANYSTAISIVFKHFPLSTKCNDGVHSDMHESACDAAYAAQAAHLQNKFWPFHDALFEANLEDPADALFTLRRIASGVGLDIRRFEADMSSPETKLRVRQDAVIAAELRVRGTPAVYLNGKVIHRLTPGLLQAIIESEIQRSSGRTVMGGR